MIVPSLLPMQLYRLPVIITHGENNKNEHKKVVYCEVLWTVVSEAWEVDYDCSNPPPHAAIDYLFLYVNCADEKLRGPCAV